MREMVSVGRMRRGDEEWDWMKIKWGDALGGGRAVEMGVCASELIT